MLCQASFRHFPYPNVPHGAVHGPASIISGTWETPSSLYFETGCNQIRRQEYIRAFAASVRLPISGTGFRNPSGTFCDLALQCVLPDVVDAEVERQAHCPLEKRRRGILEKGRKPFSTVVVFRS